MDQVLIVKYLQQNFNRNILQFLCFYYTLLAPVSKELHVTKLY